jgi:two-component system, cell cycle sensor histidine kinase and response regulator CckA
MTRVLIVDDNEENLYYLRVLLSGHGFVVDSASHGAEALVKARQVPPDLVVSDLLMPEMDGFTLLRQWKIDSRLRTIPFVVYTATYSEAEDERLALNFGADAFILKPAEPEDFLRRIREVQASGARVPPAVPSKPTLLKLYSEVLIRKLEEKTLRLEATNRELQRDITERRRAEAEIKHRGDQIQFQKLRVFKATMKTVNDIVSSLLNGFQLVRLQAGGQPAEEMLKLVDQMIEEASLKLDTLENLETVTENEMAIGPRNAS